MNNSDLQKVPFSKPSISEEEENEVINVLRSGWLTTGKHALKFEEEFSAFMNSLEDSEIRKNRMALKLETEPVQSLAVNSNTSGMILALEAFGIKQGTAVITTPYTFVSTAACAKHLGAEVLFADIEKDSYNIDPDNVRALLEKDKASENPKIKAIIPVHIGGNPCNMKKICAIAKEFNVYVIEDAAHAFPSKTKLGYAGTIGDAGIFSFYVTKTMTTAEGGMVCVRNKDAYKRMQVMRLHGMDRTTWDRYTSPKASWEYDIVAPGYKFNLPDILACIGRCQLKKVNYFYEKRLAICEKYNKAFSNIDFLQIPPTSEGNSWHLYLLRINEEKLKINRETFAKKLQQMGIGISVHFIPLFNFTYWKNIDKNFTAQNFPNSQKQYSKTISIPLWPDMTDIMINEVINSVLQTGRENHV